MLLGHLGRKLPDDEQLNLYISRLGGDPVWLDAPTQASRVRQREFIACGRCDQPCAFIGQLWTSYEASQCRVLYIFGCLNAACGADDRAWRVVRCLRRLPEGSAKATELAEMRADTGTSDHWGAATGDGCDWGISHSTGDACAIDAEVAGRLEERSAAGASGLSSATRSGAAGAKHAGRTQGQQHDHHSEDQSLSGVRSPLTALPSWPCMALLVDEEPPPLPKSGAHELELLERYQQSDLAADAAWPDALPAPAAMLDAEEDSHSDGTLRVRKDWFLKFQRRLERSPTQVLSYCWGGQPLWISEPPEEASNTAWPPPCGRCGAKRVYEAQLMPSLFYQIRTRYPDLIGDADIEWGVVVLYTCSRDCTGDEPCEEFVVVQAAV